MCERYVCAASWLLKILISAPFVNFSPRIFKLGDLERVGENTSEKPERPPSEKSLFLNFKPAPHLFKSPMMRRKEHFEMVSKITWFCEVSRANVNKACSRQLEKLASGLVGNVKVCRRNFRVDAFHFFPSQCCRSHQSMHWVLRCVSGDLRESRNISMAQTRTTCGGKAQQAV